VTPIADMVERMLAADAPAVAIVAAIRALETVTHNVTHNVTRDSNVTSRVTSREKNRIRQQDWRNRQKEQNLAREVQANDGADHNDPVTRDVTPESVTTANSVVVLSLQGKGLSVEEESKKVRKTENARARGTRLAPGAPLSDEHRAIIVAEGIHDPEKLWAEFVDYWSDIPGQRGCKISWSGTLRNRCRDVIKRGFQFTGAKNGRRTVQDAARDLHENLLERIAAFDEPAPRSLRDGTGPDVVRLLPAGRRE